MERGIGGEDCRVAEVARCHREPFVGHQPSETMHGGRLLRRFAQSSTARRAAPTSGKAAAGRTARSRGGHT